MKETHAASMIQRHTHLEETICHRRTGETCWRGCGSPKIKKIKNKPTKPVTSLEDCLRQRHKQSLAMNWLFSRRPSIGLDTASRGACRGVSSHQE